MTDWQRERDVRRMAATVMNLHTTTSPRLRKAIVRMFRAQLRRLARLAR